MLNWRNFLFGEFIEVIIIRNLDESLLNLNNSLKLLFSDWMLINIQNFFIHFLSWNFNFINLSISDQVIDNH